MKIQHTENTSQKRKQLTKGAAPAFKPVLIKATGKSQIKRNIFQTCNWKRTLTRIYKNFKQLNNN